jgi:hypothetical protein
MCPAICQPFVAIRTLTAVPMPMAGKLRLVGRLENWLAVTRLSQICKCLDDGRVIVTLHGSQ